MKTVKITYIKHSSFLVETDHAVMLFDYYRGKLPELPEGKPVYIFASHAHGDHFSPAVFDLWPDREDVTYIFSSDIGVSLYRGRRTVISRGPGEKFEIPGSGIQAETFESTDEGVAFLIRADGKLIYHAGDLNDWNWPEEAPGDKEENEAMGRRYRAELLRIAEAMGGKPADAAFIPLDPRLQGGRMLGVLEYMEICDAAVIFPMHFWKKYGIIEELKKDPASASFKDRVADIREEGQVFFL